MESAKDQRMCWLMLLLIVYKVCLPNSVQGVTLSGNESRIVERVSRKLNKDIITFSVTVQTLTVGIKTQCHTLSEKINV